MPGSEKEYRFWGKRAGAHDNAVAYIVGPPINQEIQGWLTNQVEDTDIVLELGCGTGVFSEMIAGSVKHLTVTDMAPEMIELAREKLGQCGNVKVKTEDCYETSFEDGAFDAVLMANLLHIVKEPGTVLRESARVLKDGGRILVVDYTGYGMPLLPKMGLGLRYLKKLGSSAAYNKFFSPDGLAQIVTGAGFVVEESGLIGRDTKAVLLRGRKVR